MKIALGVGSASISWSSESEEALVSRMFAVTLSDRHAKVKQIAGSSAESLFHYLEKRGADVEFVHDDMLAQAKSTYWKHMLVQGPEQIPREEFDRFVTEVGIELRPVQKEAVFKTLNSGLTVNALLCGTGKTLISLMVSYFWKWKGIRALTLIVSPASCLSEYKLELNKYRGNLSDLSIEEIYAPTMDEMRSKLVTSGSDILMFSSSSLEKLSPDIQEKITSFDGFTTFIAEEGHQFKEVNSGRSRGAQAIAPLSSRVIVNGATPMPKGPPDVRGIISLVGIPQPVESYTTGIPNADFEILRGVTFVSDETDLPYAPIRAEHMDYRDLIELTSKMQAVVNGELSQNRVVIYVSTNRAARMVWEAFPHVNKQILSGSFYVDDCEESDLKLGRSFEAQKNAIRQFNDDERCRLLIANYKVGSTGINLQYSGARLAFFFEISNNGADFFQARYRIRRPYVFPRDGFHYVYARSEDTRQRRTEDRQFAKLANQQALLAEIKSEQVRSRG
jgi:hypothetical protein